jgi:hypothetical protein
MLHHLEHHWATVGASWRFEWHYSPLLFRCARQTRLMCCYVVHRHKPTINRGWFIQVYTGLYRFIQPIKIVIWGWFIIVFSHIIGLLSCVLVVKSC